MLNPDDILREWKEDSVIDHILIDESAIRIPVLHAKYLDYLSAIRKQIRLLEAKKKSIPISERRNNPDVLSLDETIAEHKDCIDSLAKIIYAINQMSFTLSTVVKWRAFTSGSNTI